MADPSSVSSQMTRLKTLCAENPPNEEAIAATLVLRDMRRKESPSMYLDQRGLPFTAEIARILRDVDERGRLWQAAALKVAGRLIRESRLRGIKHAERREKIEDSLRLLTEVKSKIESPQVYTLLARGYFERSRIVRPKGFTMPDDKRETLKLAYEHAERAVNLSRAGGRGASDSSDMRATLTEGLRIMGSVAVEYDILGLPFPRDTTLIWKDALEEGCNRFNENIEDVEIALAFSRATGETTHLDGVYNSPLKGIELKKAKACFYWWRATKDDSHNKPMLDCARSFIKNLRYEHFASPLWEETVTFLKDLWENNNPLWKTLTRLTFASCRCRENRTTTLHMRWYWSKQRNLYDLAFLAHEGNPRKQAWVANHSKSRTTLPWKAYEQGDENMRQEVEWAEAALQDRYIIVKKLKRRTPPAELPRSPYRSLTDLADGWVAVHLYRNGLSSRGYALIYEPPAKWACEPFQIPLDDLFFAYRTWQSSYAQHKQGAYNQLYDLCKKIGDAMPFLFDIPAGSKIVFVPHDFLHRLPLHGAIKDNNGRQEVLLEKRDCFYLPSWSFGVSNAAHPPP